MKVAIRADASSRTGIGHLRRCLSLAEALRELGGDVRFVTRDLGIDSETMLAQHGFAHATLLPKPIEPFDPDPAITHSAWAEVAQEQDSKQTVAALKAFAPDWVVVDSYAFDARWHDAVRTALDCQIAVIDDLADRGLAADLVIDHNLHADHRVKYAGRLLRTARVLGGPRFALLGSAFARTPPYAFAPEVRSIGIFMGGSDASNYSELAFEAVCVSGFDGTIEVVTTSANPHLERLRERIKRCENAALLLDLPDLAAFFARHDLQIGAGGGATWERCCMGVPSLLLVVAQNQREVAPQLAAEGIAALVEDANGPAITAELDALIANRDKRWQLAERSRALVDARGAMRVAEEMQCHG